MDILTWLAGPWNAVEPHLSVSAPWRGYERELQTLLIHAVGIALYTALVFTFYRNISKRDAFRFTRKSGWRGRLLTLLQLGFVFPLMSFLYFAVLGGSLFVLAKSQETYQILLLAMSVVVGVRVTALVSENASADLAKLLPLALLGVLIVDPSYASFETTWGRVQEMPLLFPVLWRFFLVFVALEGALRLARGLIVRVRSRRSRRISVAELKPPMRKAP